MGHLPRWFRPFPLERKLFLLLRVRVFRPYVAGGSYWRKRGLVKSSREWDRSNFAQYVGRSLLLELVHVFSFMFILVIQILALADRSWIVFGVFTLLNLICNFIPVMVIRYNRHRILDRIGS